MYNPLFPISHWLLLFLVVHHSNTNPITALFLSFRLHTNSYSYTKYHTHVCICATWTERVKFKIASLVYTHTHTARALTLLLVNIDFTLHATIGERSVCLLFRCHDPNARQPFEKLHWEIALAITYSIHVQHLCERICMLLVLRYILLTHTHTNRRAMEKYIASHWQQRQSSATFVNVSCAAAAPTLF